MSIFGNLLPNIFPSSSSSSSPVFTSTTTSGTAPVGPLVAGTTTGNTTQLVNLGQYMGAQNQAAQNQAALWNLQSQQAAQNMQYIGAQQYQNPLGQVAFPQPDYTPDGPGMAADLCTVARMWMCKFGDRWVEPKEYSHSYQHTEDPTGMYHVYAQRLAKAGMMEESPNAAYVRLKPEELWK